MISRVRRHPLGRSDRDSVRQFRFPELAVLLGNPTPVELGVFRREKCIELDWRSVVGKHSRVAILVQCRQTSKRMDQLIEPVKVGGNVFQVLVAEPLPCCGVKGSAAGNPANGR